ncbi:MAG: hypothetical protein JW915_14290 [Chitinispirillaceae bacterium]|nr:hypothetical protein [Chitinispirillaceae bacterium]
MKLKILFVLLTIWCFTGCNNSETPVSNADNSDPVIIAVSFSPNPVTAGRSCLITCKASDQDNDNLSYKWVTVGNVSGSGSSIFYTPSACCGQPVIEITIEDGKGGSVDTIVNVPFVY